MPGELPRELDVGEAEPLYRNLHASVIWFHVSVYRPTLNTQLDVW